MSIATWKAEFYPEPAQAFKRNPNRSALEAVQHSTRKWEGLLHVNLAKHDVCWSYDNVVISEDDDKEDPMFDLVEVDGSSCALCVMFVSNGCRSCPLALVRKGRRCDAAMPDEGLSPYNLKRDEPEVMVMWLKRAEEYVIAQSNVRYTGGL